MNTATKRIVCASCGEEYQPNFRICPNCGSELTAGSSAAIARAGKPLDQPVPLPTPSVISPPPAQPVKNLSMSWSDTPVAPWRRWAARSLDLIVNGLVAVTTFFFVFYALAPYQADRLLSVLEAPGGVLLDVLLTGLLGSVLTGLTIGLTGSSLGKIIFGIRVTKLDGSLIGPINGVIRDLNVFLKGFGLGIPLVSLLTLAFAYKRLKSTGSTSWDAGAFLVTHRPTGNTQYVLNTFGVALWLFVAALTSAFR